MKMHKSPSPCHTPVMVAEVMQFLAPQAGEVVVDLTIGEGGHARAILPLLEPGGIYLGIDRDPWALERCQSFLSPWIERNLLLLSPGPFAPLHPHLKVLKGRKPHMILGDLGISSLQLDSPERGFSFHNPDAPLDLRMDPTTGIPAWRWIELEEENFLARWFRVIAGIPSARRLAKKIKHNLPHTMGELTELLKPLHSPGVRKNLENRLLLALRLAVNEELLQLFLVLDEIPSIVARGARVVFLTYHSAEDHLVKWAFRVWAQGKDFQAPQWLLTLYESLPSFKKRQLRERSSLSIKEREKKGKSSPAIRGQILTRKPLRPSRQEIQHNPRSHSAHLRAFQFAP